MHFKCPSCGGWAFGTSCRDTNIMVCHSYTDGTCTSNPFHYGEPGWSAETARTMDLDPCGWRGPREKATCTDEEFEAMMQRRAELRASLEATDKPLRTEANDAT